jgi:predicted TIM-barrel fold metal-dependent hydrolase
MPSYRLFDCNAMIGNTLVPQRSSVASADALLREMDRFGIEKALMYHYHLERERGNRLARDAARGSARLTPCFMLENRVTRFGQDLAGQVDRLLESGFRASRVIPDAGPTAPPLTLRVYAIRPMLERLNQHRVPLLIPADHMTTPAATLTYGFDQIQDICEAFPQIPVILLQPRYPAQQPLLSLMQQHRNVYATIDLLGLFRQVESLTKLVGPDRFLFGSNLPYHDPALGVGMLHYGLLTPSQKTAIAGGNLERLLSEVR